MANTTNVRGVSEYDDVGPREPIRQGDVVVRVGGFETPDAHIVVTADCDLSHDKYGGRLTVLPVISLDRYVRDFWIERELRTQREQLAGRLQEEMRRLVLLGRGELPEPTPERLIEWPLSVSIEELAGTLGLNQSELTEVSELGATIKSIDKLEDATLKAKWRTCCEAMFRNNIRTHERARAALVKRVSRELPRNLPGDVLYLNRPFPAASTGYMALVRFPSEIPPDAIARTPADLVYGESEYRRVSRLASPYRYRLTQLFAEVYSAIGLPTEYEHARYERFQELAEGTDNDLWR